MTTFYWITYGLMFVACAMAIFANRRLKKAYDSLFERYDELLSESAKKDLERISEYIENALAKAKAVDEYGDGFWSVKKGDFVIKYFCDCDNEYNRLCAEELAEHINEKH